MNSYELLKAIGDIDDALISEVPDNTKAHNKRSFLITVAACLIITIIASAVFFIPKTAKSYTPVITVSTNKYSFSDNEIKALCQKSISSQLSLSAPVDDNEVPEGTVIVHEDLNTMVGVTAPDIHFANKEYVVFTLYDGIFIYNYKSDEIINSISLQKLGLPRFGQGTEISSVQVEKTGRYALLFSSFDNEKFTTEYRKLDLFTGECTLLKNRYEFTDKYELLSLELSEYNNHVISTHIVKIEDSEHYCRMQIENKNGRGLLGYTELRIENRKDNTEKTYRVFGSIEPSFSQ